MSKYMSQYKASEIVEELQKQGLIKDETISDFIITNHQTKELPLYLRALIGIGTFIASLLFLAFLYFSKLVSFNDEMALMILGLSFIALAIVLQQLSKYKKMIAHTFFMQYSFTAIAIGRFSFVYGFSKYLDSKWGITFALLAITFITYSIYKISIDRFLSTLAVLISISFDLFFYNDLNQYENFMQTLFFICLIVGAGFLLTYGKLKPAYIPLAYAFVFSICFIIFLIQIDFTPNYKKWQFSLNYGNAILTMALIAAIAWAFGRIKALKSEAFIFSSLGAVILGIFTTSPIILSITLMIFGYAKHDKILLTLGSLFLAAFLCHYYYSLELTLLYKSAILCASGALLLLARLYIHYRGWNKGDAS